MYNENILNDDELENISGGTRRIKSSTTLVMDKSVHISKLTNLMKEQAPPAGSLVLNGKQSDYDGKIMVGELGTKC